MSAGDALRELCLAILEDRTSCRFLHLGHEDRAWPAEDLGHAVELARIGESFLRSMAQVLAEERR